MPSGGCLMPLNEKADVVSEPAEREVSLIM